MTKNLKKNADLVEQKRGIPIVISGPSGSGKSTICHRLIASSPNLAFSVSHTTRLPRGQEQNGVDYWFVSRGEFQSMIDQGDFIEWASYCENYYGTALKSVESHLLQGTDVLLEIEVQGARQVREKMPDAVFIFVLPPSLDVLRARLTGRGTDAGDVILKRLEVALSEIKASGWYDYILINDDLDRACAQAESIVQVAHLEAKRLSSIVAAFEEMNASVV